MNLHEFMFYMNVGVLSSLFLDIVTEPCHSCFVLSVLLHVLSSRALLYCAV